MDRDGGGPAGRTFWTVWYFIAEAVNRFLRPVPTTVASNDPTVVNSEPTDSGHTEDGASGGGVDEKLPLAPASLHASSGVIAWDTGLGPDEQRMRCKIQLSGDTESKASEEQESKREELFHQTGNDNGGHSRAEKRDEGEENVHGKVEMPENDEDEEQAKMGPLTLTDDAVTQGMKGSTSKDSTKEETQRTMTSNSGTEKMDERVTQVEDNKNQHEAKLGVEKEDVTVADYDVKEERLLEATPENEGGKHGARVSACKQLSENGTDVKGDADVEQMVARRCERDKDEDEVEESVLRDRERCEEKNMTKPAHNQPEQDEGAQPVTEDKQKKDKLTQQVTCSGDVTANAKTKLHSAEEQEDVAKLTKMRQTGCVNASISENRYEAAIDVLVDEICLEKAQVEEARQSSDMEMACTVTTVTVKFKAETAQEASGELENIPLRMCEGQVVVSPGLNSPACEETQEGVPEYNNEPGPDENTSQKFLEVGDCNEFQTSQLPEEVESLQNSGSTAAADHSCLLVKEHGKEERESTGDTGKEDKLRLVDAGLSPNRMKPLAEHVIQESGLLFEKKEGNALVHSMKMEIKDPEKEFEANALADEATEAAELQDNTEELAELETDERLSDSRDAAGESRDRTGAVAAGEVFGFAKETSKPLNTEDKIMDVSVFQESVDIINSDQNGNLLPSLLEDISKSGLLKESVETEPIICRDRTVEMQDAAIDVEALGHEVVEEAAEDLEMGSKTQMGICNPQLVDVAAEPITKVTDKSQSASTAESELDEAFEISAGEKFADAEATDSRTAAFKSKDSTVTELVTEAEGSDAKDASSGHQDVIDEEILDLWIQAVSSDDKQQEQPEQQRDAKIQQSHEEQAETSPEMDREQLLESSSGESGFLDQSLTGEWDTQPSEAQPPKSMSTESLQHNYSRQFESEFQDILMEGAAETEQSALIEKESITERGFYTDSGAVAPEARHQNQEPYKSQELSNGDHSETETGSQEEPETESTDLNMKIDCKDTEEEDIESQISGERGEGMKLPKVESLKMMHDFSNEITHNECGQPKSGSELLLEEEIKFTESSSQADTCPESQKLFTLPSLEKVWPEFSEDFVEVLEHPTSKFEDPFEVETSSLDFTAQRSRIAVKNPRIRPPRDPRTLLHMPSLDPTPSLHLPVRVPAGVPLGVGFKLPGLAAGFPVLKKTQHAVRDESSPETSREPETKPEDKSEPPKQDEMQQKPKWIPPKHPGLGNPLMSELKTKLKKTTKE